MKEHIIVNVKAQYKGKDHGFIVVGTWDRDHFESADIVHGEEIISPAHYPSIIETAIKQATAAHLKYLTDQADLKRYAVERLCGY